MMKNSLILTCFQNFVGFQKRRRCFFVDNYFFGGAREHAILKTQKLGAF